MQGMPAILLSLTAMDIRLLTFLAMLAAARICAGESYQTTDAFLQEVFAATPPSPQVLWLKGDTRETAAAILGHPYPGLRIRYWKKDARTAWILEEIGKEKPITVGLVVGSAGMELLRVLEFRESRGWEVRYPFFTDQFDGIGLTADRQLDQHIDGISGATLSVRALQKLARLALYLDQQTQAVHDPTPQD
jgi:FMN-binding domain